MDFSINWITLLASIFNLLLLYIIFKRYLFGPLVNIIRKKKEEWKQKDEELRKREEEIKQAYAKLEEEKKRLKAELEAMRERMEKEIEEEKKKLLEEAQKKADTVYKHTVNAAHAEAARIIEEATKEVGKIITISTTNILNNFLGTSSQVCLLKMLFKRFAGDIKQYASKAGKGIILELPWYVLPEEEKEIRKCLEEIGVSIAGIKVNEDIISGFRLVYKDYVLDATLNRYISEAIGDRT
jgi:F-type H+-transporting ATPase subunit b